MKSAEKYVVRIYAAIFTISIITGIIFYKVVVGSGGTNILSVVFGWQWTYLAVICLAVLLVALIKKRRNLAIAAGIVMASLAIVLVPARLIESSRWYVTGEGGPSGPHMSCLVWDNSRISLASGAYEDNLGLCTLMSIPSYNKFLIDRRASADQSDASITYYVTFAANELTLLGGGWLVYKKLRGKTAS